MRMLTPVLLLIITLFTLTAHAQLPLESRIYETADGKFYFYTDEVDDITGYQAEAVEFEVPTQDKASLAPAEATAYQQRLDAAVADAADSYRNTVPDGFGGINFGGTNGGVEANINLVRYNLHYSAKGSVPLYIMMTQKSENVVKDEQSRANMLSLDGGLINIKLADDFHHFYKPKADDDRSKKGYGSGLCDFRGSRPGFSGGCYTNVQLGVKVLDYIDGDETKYYYAPYLGAHLSFEMPISQGAVVKTKAGRLLGAIGVSAFHSSTTDVALLFPEVTGAAEMDSTYTAADVAMKFTIDNNFSISAKYTVPLSNEDVLDDVYSVQISYAN